MTVAMLLANTVESGKRYAAQMTTQKVINFLFLLGCSLKDKI